MIRLFSLIILLLSGFSCVPKDCKNDLRPEVVALEIAQKLEYPIRPKDYLRKIDDLAKDIKATISEKVPPVDAIIKHVYSIPTNTQSSLHFTEEEGLLNILFDRGEGNCISYATLFLALGRRLKVKLSPILVPGHIYLKYNERNIEMTVQGKNLSDENIMNQLHLPVDKIKIAPATNTQILSALYSNACLVAIYKKLYAQGEEFCSKAISFNENNGEAFINRSLLYKKLGKLSLSLQDAKQSVALYPYSAHAYAALGLSYAQLKQLPQSVEAYKKSIKLHPKIVRTHFNLGNVYFDMKKLKSAISSYTEAINLNNQYLPAYKNRALAYSQNKELLKAIKDYTFLLQSNDSPDIRQERAYNYYELKKYKLALKDFKQLQEKYPSQNQNKIKSMIKKLEILIKTK